MTHTEKLQHQAESLSKWIGSLRQCPQKQSSLESCSIEVPNSKTSIKHCKKIRSDKITTVDWKILHEQQI